MKSAIKAACVIATARTPARINLRTSAIAVAALASPPQQQPVNNTDRAIRTS
jgi:hypothetical protein